MGAANPTSPIQGTAALTDAQLADLQGGKCYVNVHTAANNGGEVRGLVRLRAMRKRRRGAEQCRI